METVQLDIFDAQAQPSTLPFKTQLLKWIGNKQRFAHEIISFFPSRFGRYYEPFLGSGAVLGTLGRENSLGSDTCKPLIDIWQTLAAKPEALKKWYRDRREIFVRGEKIAAF